MSTTTMRCLLFALAAALAVMLAPVTARAALSPDEMLSDPRLEARARALSAELRCLVCQNQSIDDSDAPLARDLRLLVRERLKAGDSDAEVMRFIVARYGEFVLLRPPLGWHTLLLWLTPILVLVATMGAITLRLWQPSRHVPTNGDALVPRLSPEEEARLAAALRDGDGSTTARPAGETEPRAQG